MVCTRRIQVLRDVLATITQHSLGYHLRKHFAPPRPWLRPCVCVCVFFFCKPQKKHEKRKRRHFQPESIFPVKCPPLGESHQSGAAGKRSARKHGSRPVQTVPCLVFYRRTRPGAGGSRPSLWAACVRANRERQRQVNSRPLVSNLLISPPNKPPL